MKTDNTYLYREMPVSRAIFSLAVPTVISQLVHVLYNMADTFFIGQMNDPNQVAASVIAMPLFILPMGFSNLFGIGGSSLVSRYLGKGEQDRAKNCSAFSLLSAAAIALLYGLLILAFRNRLLPLFGTTKDTYDLCYRYLFWTVCVGALPTVLSATIAHLIRAEGYSKQASIGIGAGCVLNIILDPIFIFGLRLEIVGAAMATMLSNVAATVYFCIFLFRIRGKSCINLNPRNFTLQYKIPFETAMVGLPSFVMSMMAMLSNTVLNKLVASYSSEAIAGMGIAKKIDTLAFAIATGMTQGVISLIGYNYASGDRKRMNEVIRKTFIYTLIIATAGAVFLFTCAVPVSRFFIDNAETVSYAQYFLRVLCLTCPTVSVTFIVMTAFQAMGRKGQPMVLSLLRKGGCDIPFMFLLNYLYGAYGIAWATPISDILSMTVAICMFIPFMKKLKSE